VVNAPIPAAFLDLINGLRVAALTTILPDCQPQTIFVWCNYDGPHDGQYKRGSHKARNMRPNPKVTLLCCDPRQPLCSLEMRGRVVEMTEVGALEHLDSLCELYTAV
jgi:hypothetical protein